MKSSRLRMLDFYSTHTGKHNGLSKNELLMLDNGSNFFNNLDLNKATDREIKRRAWQRVSISICTINRTSNVIKIDSAMFNNGATRKWFSIDKAKDDQVAAKKRILRAKQYSNSAKRFKKHAEYIEPQIFENNIKS